MYRGHLAVVYSHKSVSDTMCRGSGPECLAISWSVTLGSEVGQPECIVISRLATLDTEAYKTECIAISHSVTLSSEAIQSASPPAPIVQLVECPLRGTGGHRFDPGSRHTKVIKNGTSCSSLGTQIYGVELGLVDPVSG